MHIQYVGFSVVASSRIYNFLVVDSPDKTRDFTLEVQCEAFRSSLLKFQDAPGLCQARLKRELDGETLLLRARASMCIVDADIEEYLERHYPRKPRRKGPAPKPSPNRSHLW